MAGKQMEGDNTQRRDNARKAREHGKEPSAEGETFGASKQPRKAKDNASHQERIDSTREGKRGPGTSGKPRPGDRETDPKRTNRWE